jgi:elongation of very long chain fatty acids protein 6
LNLLFFSIEKKYDPVPVLHWMQSNPFVPILACVIYGLLIVLGQYYFASRPRWNWRGTMAAWNLSLAVFSFVGMARTFPQLLHNLSTMPLRHNLCADPRVTYGSGSTGLWVQLFILSKFP